MQNCSQRVDGKWHSEVLQAKRSTNELGHFSSKALAENYSFTKFHLAWYLKKKFCIFDEFCIFFTIIIVSRKKFSYKKLFYRGVKCILKNLKN